MPLNRTCDIRPCPHVSCPHHLLLEAHDGMIVLHPYAVKAVRKRLDDWTDDDVVTALEALPETCCLDVRDASLEDIAEVLGCSKACVLDTERRALAKARAAVKRRVVTESGRDDGPMLLDGQTQGELFG